MREVGRHRAATDSIERRLLVDVLAAVGGLSGRLGEAVQLAERADLDDRRSAAKLVIALCEGRIEQAGPILDDQRRVRLAAEQLPPWWGDCQLARALRVAGEGDRARALLTETLEALDPADMVPAEVSVRIELALVAACAGDVGTARDQIERCAPVLESDAGWRRLAARLDVVRGVVAVHEAGAPAAAAAFERAVYTFSRSMLPWDEAETMWLWGRALVEAGGDEGAGKLDVARYIYDECRAGALWKDHVRTLASSV
jgi:hypothetical protein